MATSSDKPVETTPDPQSNIKDDVSVATATAGQESVDIGKEIPTEITQTSDIPPEKTVKFIFRVDNATQASNVSTGHYQLLDKLTQIYQKRVKVMDNYGRHMKKFEVGSATEYATHFKIHHRPANDQRKRKAMYTIIHRVYTSLSLREIRENAEISSIMSFYKINLSNHNWTEDIISTVSFGFFINHDPTNEHQETFENKIRGKISAANKIHKNKIPTFKCTFTAPSIDHKSFRLRCKAFDIQCARDDAKTLHKLLTTTYAKSADFMFFKARYHENNAVFKKAIIAQNTYLSNVRTIPIQGVSTDLMFYLENDLLQVPGITAIHRHKDTDKKGRWNLETTKANFTTASHFLKSKLVPWTAQYADLIEEHDKEEPSLAFKNSQFNSTIGSSESSSDTGSFQSWFTTCTDTFSAIDLDDDKSLHNTIDDRPVAQVWQTPKTAPTPASTASQAPSALSSALTDQLQKDNDSLRAVIADLQKQNATFVKELSAIRQQNAQRLQPPPTLPDHDLLETLINQLIDKKDRDRNFPPLSPTPSPYRKKADHKDSPSRANDFTLTNESAMNTDP